MEEVLSAIAKMSTQDLVEIQVAVDKRKAELTDPSLGYFYDAFRELLYIRFTHDQVFALVRWNALAVTKQQAFIRAWNTATKLLNKRGLTENLPQLLISMLQDSPHLKESGLRFKDVLTALTSIEDVLDQSFPGYGPDGFTLLNLQMTK